MTEPIKSDWDWARVQYETTSRPIDDIAKDIQVPVTALISTASRQGWTRNVQSEAMKQAIEIYHSNRAKEEDRIYQIEKVNMEMRAKLLTAHRTDIGNARRISTRLFAELSRDEELDLQDKARVLKSLSESMKTFILLERQAYGITTVIEDPEKAQESSPEGRALDALMNKFVSVLQKDGARRSQGTPTAQVIDITPKQSDATPG